MEIFKNRIFTMVHHGSAAAVETTARESSQCHAMSSGCQAKRAAADRGGSDGVPRHNSRNSMRPFRNQNPVSVLNKSLAVTVLLLLLLVAPRMVEAQSSPPQLKGQHFAITALAEPGFLDIVENGDATSIEHRFSFSGYLIEMMAAIAHPQRANFTYTLRPPSGHGSMCVPSLSSESTNTTTTNDYAKEYHTQYNCGASEVHDVTTLFNGTTTLYSTDMYLGMYYVTPSRQLINQFTIPFLPPFSGTLAMFGTATGIANFDTLVQHQVQGLLDPQTTCGPGGSALIDFVVQSFPGLQIRGLFGGEDEIYQAFYDGSCQVYITDGPIAAQFVLRRSRQDQCTNNQGQPIGVIGDPMHFGLSHYAIGIRQDIPQSVVNTISYWMNILMTCNPLDPEGACPEGNFATFYEGRGGTGEECGYVLYPPTEGDSAVLSPGAIAGIAIFSAGVVLLTYTAWHCYSSARQRRKQEKRTKAALAQAEREREFNEYMAHEVRNPLASALAALSFVSSKTSDEAVVPHDEHRALINADVTVINSSLQFVNQLLRNLLDLHRTQIASEDGGGGTGIGRGIKLNLQPTDVMRDIFEPISQILFMRGAAVQIEVVCPKNLYMTTDRIRLKQVLLNLANNATKFVEKGFIRLRAEVIESHAEDSPLDESDHNQQKKTNTNEIGRFLRRRTIMKGNVDGTDSPSASSVSPPDPKSPPSGPTIVLSVEDSGPGIPLEKQKQLFDKFQDSLDVLNQGTGIGLSVCKNLSEIMGYNLGLDNEYDSGIPDCPGTRFRLITNQSPVIMENFQMSSATHMSDVQDGSSRRIRGEELPENLSILFVDDDTMLRKMFSRVLRMTAPTWKIQEASNGETALSIVEKESFDLIFMDQYMAAVEKQLLGTETVSALRAKGVKSIICGLSANDLGDQFRESGATSFMSKPFPCEKNALRSELLRVLFEAEQQNQWPRPEQSPVAVNVSSMAPSLDVIPV